MTATMSGIMLVPIIVGLIISVTLAGYLTSIVGYCNPFMLATSILTPIANGLLTTLTRTTSTAKLIIFQGLLGIGVGVGFQGPQIAIQTVLSKEDIPVGIGMIQFAQGIGPAIFVGVSQSIFLADLRKELERAGLSDEEIGMVSSGSAASTPSMNGAEKQTVYTSYARSLTQTFYLPVALSCLTAVGALGMKWRSIKQKPPSLDGSNGSSEEKRETEGTATTN